MRGALVVLGFAIGMDGVIATSRRHVFAVVGRPGCAPIAIGVGGAAAASGSVLISVLAIAGFVLGRWAALYGFVAAGGCVLGPFGGATWRRLDLVVGWLFLVGAAYYLLRVLLGAVETVEPGTGGVLAG